METKEGNKLIAEFMGFESEPFKNSGGEGFHVKLKGYPQKGNIKYSCAKYGTLQHNIDTVCSWEMYYDSSWDWLMPVVEKIAKDYDVKITWMPTAIDVTYIERPDTSDGEISSMGGMSAIENTWHAVIRFIEWYNTKSPNRKKNKNQQTLTNPL